MIVELAEDFRDALAAMPKVHPRNRIVQLLDKAIRRDSSFIAQHPHLLLQCLWHTCYWYDSPKTPEHCVWNDPTEPEKPNWPWNQSGPKLCGFMFHWAEQVKQNGSMRQWLRSSGPGGAPLNSPLVATLRGHNGTVQCVAVKHLTAAGSERDFEKLVIETEYQLLGETTNWFTRRSIQKGA